MTDPGITELRALAEKALGQGLTPYSATWHLQQFREAASPDVILALCDRLEELEQEQHDHAHANIHRELAMEARLEAAEAILNDLAALDHLEDEDGYCMICGNALHLGHKESCVVWRAVEWKGKQP